MIFVKAGEVASNTQDYVSMTGQLAVANLVMQLILMAVDIAICIWMIYSNGLNEIVIGSRLIGSRFLLRLIMVFF